MGAVVQIWLESLNSTFTLGQQHSAIQHKMVLHLSFMCYFSYVQNILAAPQPVWPPPKRQAQRLQTSYFGAVACPPPACACPEEAKLGTFGTDRGKDWGGGVAKSISWQVSHTHMSRPPQTFLLTYNFTFAPIILNTIVLYTIVKASDSQSKVIG